MVIVETDKGKSGRRDGAFLWWLFHFVRHVLIMRLISVKNFVGRMSLSVNVIARFVLSWGFFA